MTTKTNTANEPKKESSFAPGTKIYYSKSASHRLSGFKPQIKHPDGSVIADVPIIFDGHFRITDDPDEQKFIESSKSFGEDAAYFITEVDESAYEAMADKDTFTSKLKRTMASGM